MRAVATLLDAIRDPAFETLARSAGIVNAAADELDRLRTATQWRPMETAPKDGTWIVLLLHRDPWVVREACWRVRSSGASEGWTAWPGPDDDDDWIEDPAGWIPMPEQSQAAP